MNINISDAIKYIGVDDKDIDLFESQYIVPNGISYNSYVILDEKICVLDTVDKRKTDEWVANLENVLDGLIILSLTMRQTYSCLQINIPI